MEQLSLVRNRQNIDEPLAMLRGRSNEFLPVGWAGLGHFVHYPTQEVGFRPKIGGTDGKPTNEMGFYSRKTQT